MIKAACAHIAAERSKVNARYKGGYHLSPELGWMNDPNGFVYFNGRYHMFWQYHPFAANNGLMYWGHAVSEDLVRWKHLPVALAPDRDYDADGCWSGSAVVRGGRLYLVYTGHRERDGRRVQTQNLAYSDDGVNFVKYEGNPVIGGDKLPRGASIADFRDPYVWERGGVYYMLVGTVEEGAAKVVLYRSGNLIDWEFFNTFLRRTGAGFCWECPSLIDTDGVDLFACSPVDYPHGKRAFANLNSNVYAVGKVDYSNGTMTAGEFYEIDGGSDFYAAQLIKGKDGAAVMTGWMNMWGRTYVPAELGDGWTGSLILPREVSVRGGKLIQRPVRAVYAYCKNRVEVDGVLSGEKSYEKIRGRQVRLVITADLGGAKSFAVHVFSACGARAKIIYDKAAGVLTLDRSECFHKISADPRDLGGERRSAEFIPQGNILRLEIFLDRSSIEVFAGEGELVMTSLAYGAPDADGIVFVSEGETAVKIIKEDVVAD